MEHPMPKFDSGSVEEYSPGMAAFTGCVLLGGQ